MSPFEDDHEDLIENYDDDRLDVVTFCNDRAQAESIRDMLADHDIDVDIDIDGTYGDEDDGVALLAPADMVDDAREVLEQLDTMEEVAAFEADDEIDEFEDDDEIDLDDDYLDLGDEDDDMDSYNDDEDDDIAGELY